MPGFSAISRSILLIILAHASLCSVQAANLLTERECQEFGRRFASLCRQNDGIELAILMDNDALVDNALSGIELDEAQRNRSRDDYNNLYENLWPQTLIGDQKSTYYYAGTTMFENRQCIVIDGAKGINCDLYLLAVARSADGKLKFNDIYNVSDANWESELRRNQVLMRLPKDVLMRQPADVLRPLRVASNLRKITELIGTGKREDGTDTRDEAIEQIEKLSEKSRSQKPFLRIAAILYASVFSKDKFSAEIERWKRLYPQDLSVNFHAYRGYLQFGDQASAILELQALKKKAGNNPFLQFKISYHYHELGQFDEAKKAALAATMEGVSCDPIFDHWNIQMIISLKEKDYQETIRVLGDIAMAFPGFSTRDMVDTKSDFQEFRQSDEYRQWIAKARPTRN